MVKRVGKVKENFQSNNENKIKDVFSDLSGRENSESFLSL
jgi:hypothetical protein